MVFVSKVNDVRTVTSVRRMASTIAGEFLNHGLLKHIPCTGYLLPRKVLTLAYIFCNTRGTGTLNFLWNKRKKNLCRCHFINDTVFLFPCTILASLTYKSGLRPRSPPRVGLLYHVFSFVVADIIFTEFICYKPILISERFIESLSQYIPSHRVKYDRITIPSTIRKYYLST